MPDAAPTADRRAELLEHARAHYAADMLVKQTYANGDRAADFKGCSVGCFLHSIYPEKSQALTVREG